MKYKKEIITGIAVLGVIAAFEYVRRHFFVLSDEEIDMIERNRKEHASESIDSKSSTDPSEAV